MIGFIVLGLAFLFFCVLAFFAAKTWHAGHVVATVFLFLFTLLFLFLTATYFKCLDTYRPEHDGTLTKIENAKRETQRLLYGAANELPGEGTKAGELSMAREQQYTRGRLWRNVIRVPGPPNQINLSLRDFNNDGCASVGNEDDFADEEFEPEVDPEMAGEGDEEAADEELAEGEAAPLDAGPEHGLNQGQYVYAFKEFPIAALTSSEKKFFFGGGEEGSEEPNFADTDTRRRCRVPLVYMGKYAIDAVNGAIISIRPTGRPDPGQQAQLRQQDPAQVSWVLYEKLPTDRHDVFAGLDAQAIGKLVPLARLNKMSGIPISEPAYRAMLQQYELDGKPADGRVDPARVQVEVKFTKSHEEVVDFNIAGDLPEGLDQPFDVTGRAQLKHLLQGEPTTFEVDDTAFFNPKKASQLVGLGVAERIGARYSRQLKDFEYLLSDYQIRYDKVAGERANIQSEIDDLQSSIERLQQQLDKQEAEFRLLQADMKGFQGEKTELSKYLKQLRYRYSQLQGEVDGLSVGARSSGPLALTQ